MPGAVGGLHSEAAMGPAMVGGQVVVENALGMLLVFDDDGHAWLRRVATGELRDPTAFWKKMEALPTARAPAPAAVAALARAMPQPSLPARICRRVAGMGSLGRPRFVAVAAFKGALPAAPSRRAPGRR